MATDHITVTDLTPPTGTVSINGGAAGVHSLSIVLTFPSTSGDVTTVDISRSPTMAGAVTQAFAPSIPFTLTGSLTNGALKGIYVIFHDGAGNTSALLAGKAYSASDIVSVDTTRPVLKGVVTTWLVTGTTVGSTTSLRASWPSATDTYTGVGAYRVWVSKDGAAYTYVGSTVYHSATIAANPFHNYRFKVDAVDRAGNFSAAIYSALVRASTYQNTSTRSPTAARGQRRRTTCISADRRATPASVGASATLKFSGRSIGWIATLGPSRGSARVYVDGKLVTTVNLNSATAFYGRTVFTKTWTAIGTHTIKIVNLASAGHPAVDVDAFMVLR